MAGDGARRRLRIGRLDPRRVYGRCRGLKPQISYSRTLMSICTIEAGEEEKRGLAYRRCGIADSKKVSRVRRGVECALVRRVSKVHYGRRL